MALVECKINVTNEYTLQQGTRQAVLCLSETVYKPPVWFLVFATLSALLCFSW